MKALTRPPAPCRGHRRLSKSRQVVLSCETRRTQPERPQRLHAILQPAKFDCAHIGDRETPKNCIHGDRIY